MGTEVDDGLVLVVVGTDTGVGKTWVGAALARALARRGLRVIAVKPVESGCGETPGPAEDGVILAEASGQTEPRAALVRLRAPVAPPVAADLEGVALDLDELVGRARRFGAECDVLLVEGAGGLCSPLSWDGDLVDVARALDGVVLLVGSDRLGVVNHVVLTMTVALGASLSPLGVVLTAPLAPDASTGTNADTLRRTLGGRESGSLYDRVVEAPRGDWANGGAWVEEVVRWVTDATARDRTWPGGAS
jgi:dethiobiotin synthetase